MVFSASLSRSEQNATYEELAYLPVEYRILKSHSALGEVFPDPRYWRIVEVDETRAVNMLRVPLQVKNAELLSIQGEFAIRLADRAELSAAFRSGQSHQYKYPWGDQVSAKNAPFLLHSNPDGMGMNVAGLYFNGPDNGENPEKNGLWMVTAERDEGGNYISGDRSGTAGNVGVFSVAEAESGAAMAGNRGVLPESRGILPENRGVLPENRGMLPGHRGALASGNSAEEDNFLTPAGIGEGLELYPNEGYLIVKDLSHEEKRIYDIAKVVLGNKVSADHGIAGISIGDATQALGKTGTQECPVIVFGVFGHCLSCPNPRSLTMPINCPEIADKTGVPVIEYPEFENHQVVGRRPIVPDNQSNVVGMESRKRVYYPMGFSK